MSALRKEYEAVFGVVKGTLRLYDAEGNEIYYEHVGGELGKYQYDAEGNMIYSEHSVYGVMLDKRPSADKVLIEEQTGKKFKLTEIK
jgi:YD repeat-containing protein|tara:strand:- start:267 stop:527 length:261 start_codon:yes stop_codon:yes gene_type:complete